MTYLIYPGLSMIAQRKAYHKLEKNKRLAYSRNWNRIVNAIFQAEGVTLDQLQGKDRKVPMPYLRAIMARELYVPGTTSVKRIAEDLKKDHTTILYYLHDLLLSLPYNDAFKKVNDNVMSYF